LRQDKAAVKLAATTGARTAVVAEPGQPAVAAAQSGFARRWLPRVAPFCGYLLIALVFLMPLPLRLTSAVIGDSSDIWIHLWWMWQVRESLLHGQNPYFSYRVFHPTGAPLYLMGQDMVTALLSIPLQGLLGLVLTYNLLTIAAVAFGAWAMYLLALDVTGSRPGALVAGALFGFAPLQASLLNLGQMEYVNIGFLPLSILFLLRLRPAGPRWTPLVGAVLGVLTILSSWYQGMFLALFSVCFIAYEVLLFAWRRRWHTLRDFSVRLADWGRALLVLIAPVLLPTIRLARGSKFAEVTRTTIAYSALGLFDAFRPDRLNPLFGAHRAMVAYSLGYLAILLGLLGLWRVWRRGIFWALVVVLFYLLALGPFLRIGARQWDLPLLPYNLLYRLPMGNIARVPLRFLIVITIALSILAAWGVGWLVQALARRWPQRATLASTLATGAILALVLAELFPAPRPTAATAIEPFYTTLAAGPPGAVYELPYDDRALAMYHATAHKRPVIGGYVSRPVPYPLLNGVAVISELRNRSDQLLQQLQEPDIVQQQPLYTQAVAIFDAYDIRYVILRRDSPLATEHPDQMATLIAALNLTLPRQLIVYDQGPLLVYQIPHEARTGAVTGLGSGWYALERRADTGQQFRWANGDAVMPVTLLDSAPRTATISATIFSYARPATVELWLNDRLLTTVTATPAAQQITVTAPLTHGDNELHWRAREAPVQPSAFNGTHDNRFLSFALADVRVTLP
jgi:hypothetical protein